MSNYDKRLVQGPLVPAVWVLAWPMILQNLVQMLQSFVDHAMVGRIVGYEANAAIGVSLHIFMVVVIAAGSLQWGMGVLVARFAGANDPERVNRVVLNAGFTSLALGAVLAPLGWIATPYLLDLVQAEPAVREEATSYLRVLFLGGAAMLTNTMLASALRAVGDSRTPLHFGVLLTVLNIGLNILLIGGLGPIPALGTLGAALGTILAQGFVLVLAVVLLVRGHFAIRLPPRVRFELATVGELFRFGLPASLQGIAVNLGYVFLVRYIGALESSAEAQAAYAVAYTQLFMFYYMVIVALMSATQIVVGQCLGAEKMERAVRAPRASLAIGGLIAGASGALFLTIPNTLLGLFSLEDPKVLELSHSLLAYMSFGGLLVAIALIYTGALQGAGDTKSPAAIVLISQIVVPLGYCAALDLVRELRASDIWMAILLGHLARAALAYWCFQRGRWREIRVELREE